jgi:hypothetical protein
MQLNIVTKAVKYAHAARRQRCSLKVAALQHPDSSTETRTPQSTLSAFESLQNVQKSYERFRHKYEHNMLSAGVGALLVTTYCVLKGQSPLEAAGITVCATILSLVLNELLFSDEANH